MPAKYQRVREWNLHYLHTGATTLPDVPPALDRGTCFVFVHGAGRNAGDFKRQIAGLESTHSAVALDLPGHGRATGLDALPSIDDYATVVEEFLDAAVRRRFVLVGWSMGASIALRIAARRPEQLAGMALIAGSLLSPHDATVVDRTRDVVRGRLPQQFDMSLFGSDTSMDLMREVWMEQVRTDPRVLLGDLLALQAFDAQPLLARVAVPTLVIHGAADKLVTTAQAEALAAGIPGARLEVIDQAGHVPHVEQSERVNALLAAFGEACA